MFRIDKIEILRNGMKYLDIEGTKAITPNVDDFRKFIYDTAVNTKLIKPDDDNKFEVNLLYTCINSLN